MSEGITGKTIPDKNPANSGVFNFNRFASQQLHNSGKAGGTAGSGGEAPRNGRRQKDDGGLLNF